MNQLYYLESDIKEISNRVSDLLNLISGKTFLITGGNGFLGRYFRAFFHYLNQNLLENPCKVILLDNFVTSQQRSFSHDSDNIVCISHDVCQPFTYDGPVNYVIHAAGIASPFYYRAKPLLTLQVATRGTENMLNLAREKNARFTFFSSSEIYGDPDPKCVPIQESYRGNVSALGPRACYDESKRLGETLCYIYHQEFGLHTNMIRPFNVYGPGMQEKDYRVMPNFLSRILNSRPLQIYGSGNQTRTFCYITDAIDGFLRVILSGIPGEPYNIGQTKPEVSIRELASILEQIHDEDVIYHMIDYPDSYPADEPQRRCPDLKKADIHLGYMPQVDLEAGLNRFYHWASEHYAIENASAIC